MPSPAADQRPRTPGTLAWLAGLACLGCCLLPLLAAGGLLGTGATAVAQGLPALAANLAIGAVTSWWWLKRRAGRCTCTADRTTACGCAQDTSSSKPDPATIRP
ncbi:hypothetical protein ACFYTG_08740 [Streptomyces mirabilis]|uniref:hypothetical protein n=1 Tax=Streptomyces mirabilis TaxID=68239 RepID=UPI00367B3680